jgi:hypothetical protein
MFRSLMFAFIVLYIAVMLDVRTIFKRILYTVLASHSSGHCFVFRLTAMGTLKHTAVRCSMFEPTQSLLGIHVLNV